MGEVIGIDVSLTCTGVASSKEWTVGLKGSTEGCVLDRVRLMRDRVLLRVPRDVDLVVIEGMAVAAGAGTGTASGLIVERGALLWMIIDQLDRWGGCPIALAAPTTLKAHWAGSGRATKTEMMTSARQLPWFAGGPDEADALAACSAGLASLGRQLPSWRRPVREGRSKVQRAADSRPPKLNYIREVS